MPKFLLTVLYIVAVVFLAYLLLLAIRYVFPLLIPFFIASMLSVLIDPLVRVIQTRLHISRGLSVLLSMAIVLAVLGTLVALVIIKMISELMALSVSLPAYLRVAETTLLNFFNEVMVFYGRLHPSFSIYLQQAIGSISASLKAIIATIINSFIYLASAVPSVVIIVVVSLLATYFISRDGRMVSEFLFGLLPPSWGGKLKDLTREVLSAGLAYLRAQLILVGITTVISIAGLYLIGEKYALLLGLVVGFFDLIPLGPAAFYVPWLAWSFLSGAGIFGLELAVLYIIIFIVRQLFESRIVAANLGLHPLAVLVAMYAGLRLMGFWGILLGLLVVIVLKALSRSGIIIFKLPR